MKVTNVLLAAAQLSLVRGYTHARDEDFTEVQENTSHLSTENEIVGRTHEYPSLTDEELQYIVEFQLGGSSKDVELSEVDRTFDNEETYSNDDKNKDDSFNQDERSADDNSSLDNEPVKLTQEKVLIPLTRAYDDHAMNVKRDDQSYTTGWNIYFTDVTVTADVTVTNVSTVTSQSSVMVTTTSKKTTSKKTTSKTTTSSSTIMSSKRSSSTRASSTRASSTTASSTRVSSFTTRPEILSSSTTISVVPSVASSVRTTSKNQDISLIAPSSNSLGAFLLALFVLL